VIIPAQDPPTIRYGRSTRTDDFEVFDPRQAEVILE
jgi:hypothetical protein